MEKIKHPVHQIRCPHCRKTLYLPIIKGHKQICCPACASVYSFKESRFLEKSVEPEEEDRYRYRLRVQSDQGIEAISFRAKDPKLSFFKQDQLLILQTENSVTFLKNLTEGWSRYFHDSQTVKMLGMGTLSLLIGGVGSLFVSWWAFIATPFIGGGLYWLTRQKEKDRRLVLADQLQDAKSIQKHLSVVSKDNETLLKINEELEDSRFTLERIQAIREEQPDSLSELDTNILDRAIPRLGESLKVMRDLKGQYEKRLDRIWLDIEIRNLAAKIPDVLVEYQLQSQELEAQFQAELEAIAEIKSLVSQVTFSPLNADAL